MTTATVQVSLTEFLSIVLQGSAAGISADSYDPPKLMLLGGRIAGAETVLHPVCISVTASAVFVSWLKTAYRATVSDLIRKEQYAKASKLARLAGYVLSPALLLLLGDACMCTLSPCIYRSHKIRTLKKLDKNLSVQAHAAYL